MSSHCLAALTLKHVCHNFLPIIILLMFQMKQPGRNINQAIKWTSISSFSDVAKYPIYPLTRLAMARWILDRDPGGDTGFNFRNCPKSTLERRERPVVNSQGENHLVNVPNEMGQWWAHPTIISGWKWGHFIRLCLIIIHNPLEH